MNTIDADAFDVDQDRFGPQDGPEYTSTPSKARIVWDETQLGALDPGETPVPWQLDGIDAGHLRGTLPDGRRMYAYTEHVWNFATHAEAMAAVPEFWARYIAPGLAS